MSTLTMYNFSKRKNSTAAPASAGVDFDVTLKDRTDILNPVFRLALASFPAYNYAQFLGRYYFVTGIESVTTDIWDISCSVDVLATYKSAIQSTSAFVLFDTTANTEVIDTRLSLKTTKTVTAESGAFTVLGNGTSAVLSITGKDSTSTYAMSVSQAEGILSELEAWLGRSTSSPLGGADMPLRPRADDGGGGIFSSVEDAIQDVSDTLTRGFRQFIYTGKAGDSIKDARIIPIDLTSIWTNLHNIYLGDYQINSFAGHKLPTGSSRIVTDVAAVQIPWQFTDWRRNSPYTELYLYIPYVGMIHLNASELIGETVINVFALVDGATGDALFVVSVNNRRIAQYNTNIAANMPIGASNVTPLQAVTQIGAAVGGVAATIASHGSVLPAMAGLAGIIGNAQPTQTTIGSNTGAISLAIEKDVRCYCVTHDTNVSPDSVSAIMGTPARAVKSLSGLSGFVQTVGASVAGMMTESERDAINNLLNGGVYIE